MKERIKAFLRWLIEVIDRGKQISEYQRMTAEMHGDCLESIDLATKVYQSGCNHRKGGSVNSKMNSSQLAAALQKGTNSSYCVMKHQIMNGDIWVWCTRCGKKWKPPIREDFKKEKHYLAAVAEYKEAVNFETNNAMSTSLQFRFADRKTGRDATETVRKMMAAA